ncbi:MAG: flippase-like domain-containing protein [Deltaproteobacteria bacterium]|nr:flippase-like domain-containing protein [Deltaproteobacteria bacterium]
MKKAISVIIKIAVSGAILYALFSRMDPGAFWKTLRAVDLPLAVLSGFIFTFSQFVSTYRWSVILKKDIGTSYLKLLSIYFIGMFFNNFLPTAVGGDVVKGYYLYRESKRGDISLASIFMDRYVGFAALILMAAMAVIPGYALIEGAGIGWLLVVLIGGFTAMSLVIWVGPLHSWVMAILAKVHFYGINRKIDTFYKVLMGYKRRPQLLVRIFILSFVVQGSVILGYFILSRGLGMNVGFGYFFLFIPLTTTVSMLPVSVSGLGLRESAFVFLFMKAGARAEEAFTLSILWFGINAVVSMIGGVEYLRMGGKAGDAAAEISPE